MTKINYEIIDKCRVCNSEINDVVIDLKDQALTGVFVKDGTKVPKCDMTLGICSNNSCQLVQILQAYDLSLLYGDNYGYESSLNQLMIDHLRSKAQFLDDYLELSNEDIVLDIGSNDATTLGFFPHAKKRIGVDIIGTNFLDKYQETDSILVPDFFPSSKLKEELNGEKVRLVSSYSCFYDLPDPVSFTRSIADILHEDGIWCLEQSYMPTMLDKLAFDTICHEHIEYYKLIDIKNICNQANLQIVDVSLNDVNGGSFSVIVAHPKRFERNANQIEKILNYERSLNWKKVYLEFNEKIENNKSLTIDLLKRLKGEGKRVFGLGASTKGNVLLQHYSINNDLLEGIFEVNSNKFGQQTPGTAINILDESKISDYDIDYLFVLPWHFKSFFVNHKKFKQYKLIFPLTELTIIGDK